MKRITIILRDGETIIGSPYKDKYNRPLFTYPKSPTLKDFAMLDDMMALHLYRAGEGIGGKSRRRDA